MLKMNKIIVNAALLICVGACGIPNIVEKSPSRKVPQNYAGLEVADSSNMTEEIWHTYFKDTNLIALIDTALLNNQELNIAIMEVKIAKNEIREKKGEYLPFVGIQGSAGMEKVPRYTSQGANDANTDIDVGKKTPEVLGDFSLGAYATWEIDIWNKLHNSKKAAVLKYLASSEGQKFMVTHLISEIANSYYELLALDNQLAILTKNIAIQSNALEVVKLQKKAAKVTELAVKRFEAQVLKTKSIQYDIQQRIIETENRINFLVGRYPQGIKRASASFEALSLGNVLTGIPSQLLQNRPDVMEAEMQLEEAKLNVKVAKANFYPSFRISASSGLGAFNPAYLVKTPESLLTSLVGDLTAPLINRNAIKAVYKNANSKQVQAAFNYERTILNAYLEVVNEISNIENLANKYKLKSEQVDALNASVDISNNLFKSARADYMEVLLTQRDALESKFELIETKKRQLMAMVNVYRALGGGWRQDIR